MTALPFFEASVPEGLEQFTQNELGIRLGGQAKLLHPVGQYPGLVQFSYPGKLSSLLQLRTVLSLFAGLRFDVPRPRALMGHQNFEQLIQQIETVRDLSPKGSFQTLYLAAAGSESSVMTRFAEDIASRLKLRTVPSEGDLLLRVRRPLNGSPAWDVLVRLTPRPLSVRKWRVCDLEGALNAAAANAAALISRPAPGDVFLNLACGSGTLLIERAANGPSQMLIGCDINPAALACARQNIAASGSTGRIKVYPWDARRLPLADSSIDVLCADLPFGLDVGSHEENLRLYPELLREAARVARPTARFIAVTQEIRLMNAILAESTDWRMDSVIPFSINGLHPRIYTLKKLQP